MEIVSEPDSELIERMGMLNSETSVSEALGIPPVRNRRQLREHRWRFPALASGLFVSLVAVC